MPFSFGPAKLPPKIGMTARLPCGTAPMLDTFGSPRVTFVLYKYVRGGGLGSARLAVARERIVRACEIILKGQFTTML